MDWSYIFFCYNVRRVLAEANMGGRFPGIISPEFPILCIPNKISWNSVNWSLQLFWETIIIYSNTNFTLRTSWTEQKLQFKNTDHWITDTCWSPHQHAIWKHLNIQVKKKGYSVSNFPDNWQLISVSASYLNPCPSLSNTWVSQCEMHQKGTF